MTATRKREPMVMRKLTKEEWAFILLIRKTAIMVAIKQGLCR